MPIGVPRIIYCWGEELPPQWTDIYNFIFRRRMVFLMQYLDDELCNQICGLLINIHMEDRSKELEKKEMSGFSSDNRSQKSAVFKSGTTNKPGSSSGQSAQSKLKSKFSAVEDLLTSLGEAQEDDLAIDQNNMLEQYTLQKITMEWLNWNAQFFDYSDSTQSGGLNPSSLSQNQAYLYYLADILSKDFTKDMGNLGLLGGQYSSNFTRSNLQAALGSNTGAPSENMSKLFKLMRASHPRNETQMEGERSRPLFAKTGLEVYAPFRFLANFAAQYNNNNKDLNSLNPLLANNTPGVGYSQFEQFAYGTNKQKTGINKLLNDLAQQKLTNNLFDSTQVVQSSEKALGQRRLKREYLQDRIMASGFAGFTQNSQGLRRKGAHQNSGVKANLTSFDYNSLSAASQIPFGNKHSLDANQFYRKQTGGNVNQRGLSSAYGSEEEESKKVFVIINSFGGSVGNGITVHDALQFIKAGSLTLGLGVAASAASLVLAGGTIGERYVTEGCHTMIHQPESGLNGQASDIWIDANEIMKIRLDVAEIYSLSTYRPRHKILRDLDRDFYLTATETIQYGLADEIATNEVMHNIIEMTSKVWDIHDSQQQRLLESRESASSGLDTQTQS